MSLKLVIIRMTSFQGIFALESMPVICCCITNHPKTSSLKCHYYYYFFCSCFCGMAIYSGLSWYVLLCMSTVHSSYMHLNLLMIWLGQNSLEWLIYLSQALVIGTARRSLSLSLSLRSQFLHLLNMGLVQLMVSAGSNKVKLLKTGPSALWDRRQWLPRRLPMGLNLSAHTCSIAKS